MLTDSLVFPFWRIALTASIALIASFLLLRWRYPAFSARDTGLIAITVAVSVLLWRLAGNVTQLNADPIPLISPNDVLCPVVTYVLLGLYGASRRVADARWEQARAWLTLISLIVNVVAI